MNASKDTPVSARPKKSLGQNFLTDRNITEKIVAGLHLCPDDTVFEIGPGRGALTDLLAPRVRKLYALEKDRYLVRELKRRMPGLLAINGDGLTFAWERLAKVPGIKLVGNLPYNVASPMMWEIFSRARGFERACFMVQKEVAGRLVAESGSRAYGGLSVWVQSFVIPRIGFHVSPGSFHPRPKVDSTVVIFEPGPTRPENPEGLAWVIHLLFQQRRKQLGTILKSFWGNDIEEWLAGEGLDRRVRPEVLTPRQFHCLGNLLEKRRKSALYQNCP